MYIRTYVQECSSECYRSVAVSATVSVVSATVSVAVLFTLHMYIGMSSKYYMYIRTHTVQWTLTQCLLT